MKDTPDTGSKSGLTLPPDDLARTLVIARSSDQASAPYIGLVRDTYTVLLAGKDTAGRFCLIDMHIPPGGGPPPHRRDFEESFILLEGEIEATFRGVKLVVREGQTVHIPANAPHQFQNTSTRPPRFVVHLLSCRAGRVLRAGWCPGRNPNDSTSEAGSDGPTDFRAKAEALAPKYRTEFLRPA